jgi:C4-type Zn-finger protein
VDDERSDPVVGNNHSQGAPVPGRPSRMGCPLCGSTRTQPFPHGGPAARVNMRCLNCGHQFRDKTLRR